jgi:hypothetical protein
LKQSLSPGKSKQTMLEYIKQTMKKHTVIATLLPVFVLVVGVVIGYLLTPSGQAWAHDWVANPVGLTATATVGAVIATFCAVLVALFGMRNERIKAQADRKEAQEQFLAEQRRAQETLEDERRRFKEAQEVERERFKAERVEFEKAQEEGRRQFLSSQKQTQDALEEGRRQFLEAQYATNRPLLVPLARHLNDIPTEIEWDHSVQFINIQNGGTGVATNIWGVLMSPISWSSIIPSQYHIRLPTPLLPGAKSSEDPTDTMFKQGRTIFNSYEKIGEYSLGVPEERAAEENIFKRRDRCIARLTLTCSDIFGRKHASIFDYTIWGEWINVDFLPNIEHDLGDMNEAKGVK